MTHHDFTYMSSAYSIQKKFGHFILSVKLSLTDTQICLSLQESYNVSIEKTTFFFQVLQNEKKYLDLKRGGWHYNLHVHAPENSEGYKIGKI